jgi:hypothetical protein
LGGHWLLHILPVGLSAKNGTRLLTAASVVGSHINSCFRSYFLISMKTVVTLLLLAGIAGIAVPQAQAGPGPVKKAAKVMRPKGLAKLFAPRQRESSYAKAIRRNELFR